MSVALLALLRLSVSSQAAVPVAPDLADVHDGLLARFDAEAGNAECLTGLVQALHDHWDLFTPAERARMTGVLAPFKHDLFDALPVHAPAAPPSNFASDTCFGQQNDNRVVGNHFVVEWNDGAATQATAQSFLEDLEFAYTAEIEELGWNPPATDGRYLMLVMISDQNMGGAYTTVSSCGGVYAPYIVAGKDAVTYGSWTEEMAAHEFNHSIQFNTSFAPEAWWWEATATYVQGIVRTTNNWADYVSGYSALPYIAMGASSQSDQDIFYHMYGMMIWGVYLDNYQGGGDVVRQTWENAMSERSQYGYSAPDMMADLGLDFDTVYTDFITRNAAMDYSDHDILPKIDIVDRVSELPASGAGDGDTRPQGYGQNYIRISSDAGSGPLTVDFTGDSDVDWVIVLAESSGDAILRSASTMVSGGSGQVTLDDFGTDDVYLIVSPLTDSTKKRDYSWTASVPPPADTGDDTGAGGNGGGNGGQADGTGVEKSGCGCASAPDGGALALASALAALGLARRRR